MKCYRSLRGLVLSLALFAGLGLVGAGSAAAQAAGPPDFAQFGFPQVAGSALFTPGTAATVTAGTQQVVLPADFMSKPVKFELLTGDPQMFAPLLAADDQGRPILAAWAFRVTDPATGQLVGHFDKPAQWSVTDPRVAAGTSVYNTSPATPPAISDNPTPGTVSGTTFAHSFGGAGVGWLALAPAAATAPPATPTPPAGMPATGSPVPGGLWLAVLAGLLCATAGLAVRRRRVRG